MRTARAAASTPGPVLFHSRRGRLSALRAHVVFRTSVADARYLRLLLRGRRRQPAVADRVLAQLARLGEVAPRRELPRAPLPIAREAKRAVAHALDAHERPPRQVASRSNRLP